MEWAFLLVEEEQALQEVRFIEDRNIFYPKIGLD